MLTGTTINKVVSLFRTTYSLIQHDVASQRNGQETRVGGDVAYSGQCDVIRQHAPNAKSFVQAKAHRHRPRSEEERARNRTKSKIRAKIEQAFLVIKWILG